MINPLSPLLLCFVCFPLSPLSRCWPGILNEAEFWQIEGVVSALRAQLPPDLTRSDVIKFRSQISSFAGLHLPKINLSGSQDSGKRGWGGGVGVCGATWSLGIVSLL